MRNSLPIILDQLIALYGNIPADDAVDTAVHWTKGILNRKEEQRIYELLRKYDKLYPYYKGQPLLSWLKDIA